MATKRNNIKKVAKLMRDGLEKPEKKGGKMVLTGEYVTMGASDFVESDMAFIVNGEEDDRFAYFVQINAVDLHE